MTAGQAQHVLPTRGVVVSAVTRRELEAWTPVPEALARVSRFLDGYESYPLDPFLRRRGINKALAEEYLPLVYVAQAADAACVKLLPASNSGPDGAISFLSGDEWFAQITCSHEGADRASVRAQAASGEIASRPTVDVDARVERIVVGVRKKEANFHSGTDALIILDDPDALSFLREERLRDRVREAVRGEPSSQYHRIYVVYGCEVDRVR